VTIADPETGQDMILLSFGEPPAGMIVTAPIVMDISEPKEVDKSSPLLYQSLGFLIPVSQRCIVRYEWDFDYNGTIDKMGYWGNNKPVFLGPGFGGQDTLTVTDNNVPAKTTTYYVGGPPPETLGPGKIIIPNSNMGFKLNLVPEDPGEPGLFSNMGFKLNYAIWQGGNTASGVENWWGHCNAWSMGTWALLPIDDPSLASVRYAGTGLGLVVGAFDGNKQTDGCEVDMSDPLPMEEISFNFSGSGQMVLFYAANGWETRSRRPFDHIGNFGPAAVAVMEGEGWSIRIEKKKKENRAGGGSEDDIVFLYPEFKSLSAGRGAFSTVNCGQGQEEMAWEWDRDTNTWMGLIADADGSEGIFVRGEVNLDTFGSPDISDGIFILQWLFCGGKEPLCVDAADVNDDGTADISDGIALLAYLFTGGSPPGAPFPGAGGDPTPDSLSCDLLQ
jgi:hypothetical protein